MSSPEAIAAVTATLRNLIESAISTEYPGSSITTKPLDKARAGTETPNQINLFLYRTEINGAWRNMDMPRQVRPNETGQPPMALVLYYLVTAYGENDDDTAGHRLLGRAMSVLHDHPLLGADEIQAALPGTDTGLAEQVERVRITPEPLCVDGISKLWSAFQSQYRISAAYQASVVLIESTRATKAPLPVLTRGPADEGVAAQADLTPPFPTLESVEPPNAQPAALLGDLLVLEGHHLGGDNVAVRFMNSRLTGFIEVAPQPGRTDRRITVQIPDQPASWVAGFYTVAALISRTGEPDRLTNEAPFLLAPRIASGIPATVARDTMNNVTLTLTCSPQVRPAQRAALLLGDREIVAEARTAQTDPLVFQVSNATAGQFFVRVRVDGVDSLLVDRSQTPPVFDSSQRVTIT